MKATSFTVLPILTGLAFVPTFVLADANPLDGSSLQNITVFSKTYSTIGADSTVNGSVSAGAATTVGANSTVTGKLSSVAATTTGVATKVGGNIDSGAAATIAADGKVGGNITAGGAATVGASAQLAGNLATGGAVTVGASSVVTGSVKSGGAADIGASAQISGDVAAVGAITLGAGAQVGSLTTLFSSPVDSSFAAGLETAASANALLVDQTRSYLSNLGSGTLLLPEMTTNMTLHAGVYSAQHFVTTAGTTLTLDGQGLDNQSWVFNIADYLTTGAITNMVLINGGANDSIFWNIGGYAALAANASFLGLVLANDYVSVGAEATVAGINGSCGGLFSALSNVTVGAGSVIGGAGCGALPVIGAVPEPQTYALLLGGIALLSFVTKRRLGR